ncbi:hypothetical protein TMatcc_002367 [Talaromyces marneffei ATCC 18224]|uniref:NmrA-like domain-containing protein n=1 Tax=Talaromyces marneffei (strain ATCC 18224 / CBS 334.59 / QM 7333) TaxID=441960 RepID=B6QJM0_TALMQ|nr:conserved hypothetical protein [Talaromyces marneffei ATCC 18224]
MSKLLTVFGATGNQGGSVIQAILADPALSKEYKVRGITRDVSKESAKRLASQGVEMVAADLSSTPQLLSAIQGSHTVFLITNFWETTNKDKEISQGKAVTDACKQAGVQHLIFSSLRGITELTGGQLSNVAYLDTKAEIENYIRESSVPATFVLAAFYMTNFSGALKKRGHVLTLEWPVDPEMAKVPVLDVNEDTGKFVKAVIKKLFPSTVGKRVLMAAGYYTPNQIVTEIAETLGVRTAAVKVPQEAFTSFLAPELTQGTIENLLVMEAEGYYGGESLEPSLALLEEKPVSWKEFVQRNSSLFV